MSKLTGKYEYRKDGNKHLKGYSISLAKTKVEEVGFDINSDIDIIYKKIRLK